MLSDDRESEKEINCLYSVAFLFKSFLIVIVIETLDSYNDRKYVIACICWGIWDCRMLHYSQGGNQKSKADIGAESIAGQVTL